MARARADGTPTADVSVRDAPTPDVRRARVAVAALFSFLVSWSQYIQTLLIGGGLVVWALVGRDFVTVDNLLAGLGIGAVVVAMWVSLHTVIMPVKWN